MYFVLFDVNDTMGNSARTVIRMVEVLDVRPPVVSLHGFANVSHEAEVPYSDAKASWVDDSDGSGLLLANETVDWMTPGIYVLSYRHTDKAGNVSNTVTRTVTVVPNTSVAPSFDGNETLNLTVVEGKEFYRNLFAEDPDGDRLYYAIDGGDDESEFSVNEFSGGLSMVGLLDFENPRDADKDNLYEVQVSVMDNRGGSDQQIIRVRVENDPADDSWSQRLNGVSFVADWYSSEWLGVYWDFGGDWIFHLEHGWLYPTEDATGHYWLYHTDLGWLWTGPGPSLYGSAKGDRFLFSQKSDSWLYYESSEKTFYVYKNSTRMNHAGVAVARLQVTSSDASIGQVTGGGYYEIGAVAKLTAVANSGYRLTEWRSSTRGVLGTEETLEIQVDRGESITGVFAKMSSEDILGGVFD